MRTRRERGQTTVEWMILGAVGLSTGPVFGPAVAVAALVLLLATVSLVLRRAVNAERS